MKLLEHEIKSFLRDRGIPVPEGQVATSPAAAAAAAQAFGGRAVVKALIAAGRRGKAGAVRIVDTPDAAGAAAASLLDTVVAGCPVEAVYVEARVPIREELYLSFTFGSIAPQMVVSLSGGVDIEEVARTRPGAVVVRAIDPLGGLRAWHAAAAWEAAGAPSAGIPRLAEATVRLYEAFRDGDALMLELNPVAVTDSGSLSIVGAMAEIDDNALFRHPDWASRSEEPGRSDGPSPNPREQQVRAANRALPGASVRYTELDGDIGLMVSGGGAGLLQHDLVLAAGEYPSCHTDLSPTPTAEKPAALLEAILANPRTRGLLIGFNYLQLARCDLTVEALLLALDRTGRDTRTFPVVLRLFGPHEDEARRLAAQRPGMTYLPAGATLADGVDAIVAAVRRVREREDAREDARDDAPTGARR